MDATYNILVVDDDSADRQSIVRALRTRSEQFVAVECDNACDGLARFKSAQIDCVIIDYRLAGMNGIEFIEELKTEHARHDVPIIIWTGQGDERVAAAALRVGAYDYLIKEEASPVSIIRTIEHAIAYRSAQTNERNATMRLRQLALYDTLTGAMNRNGFEFRVEHAIDRSKRQRQRFSLLLLDLNGFKPINDTHGHAVGDAVLRETASRLGRLVRGSDTVARYGGDEFVVAMETGVTEEGVISLIERIKRSISEPVMVDNLALHVSASIGKAIFPDDGASIDALLRHADAEMYQQKWASRQRDALTIVSVDTSQTG